jgi:hypothetical protein
VHRLANAPNGDVVNSGYSLARKIDVDRDMSVGLVSGTLVARCDTDVALLQQIADLVQPSVGALPLLRA